MLEKISFDEAQDSASTELSNMKMERNLDYGGLERRNGFIYMLRELRFGLHEGSHFCLALNVASSKIPLQYSLLNFGIE